MLTVFYFDKIPIIFDAVFFAIKVSEKILVTFKTFLAIDDFRSGFVTHEPLKILKVPILDVKNLNSFFDH